MRIPIPLAKKVEQLDESSAEIDSPAELIKFSGFIGITVEPHGQTSERLSVISRGHRETFAFPRTS